jgi:hypothetical protein
MQETQNVITQSLKLKNGLNINHLSYDEKNENEPQIEQINPK